MPFRGNLIFTNIQENIHVERFNNQNNSLPSNLKGYNNDVGFIKRGGLEFIKDLELGVGNDTGGWYPTANMVVDGGSSNPFQPFGSNYGLPRKLYNMIMPLFELIQSFISEVINEAPLAPLISKK